MGGNITTRGGETMEPWSINTLLICFAGGILGTALGGLWAFVACGFIVLAGCAIIFAGGSDFVLMQVGLGPIFGPHIGFCGGVIAASYAAGIRKNLASATGKDILSPLVATSWDVLLVGGFAAVLTHVVLQILVTIPVIKTFDCIALAIVLVSFVARLICHGEMPWGNRESIKTHGWLGTGGYAISWVPWMAPPARLAVIGFGVGIFSGALAMGSKTILDPMAAAGTISATGAFVVPLIIGWALAAICLAGLNLGTGEIQKFPVWHCMAILSALAYLHFGSLLVAGLVGLGGAFLQELMARMFWNHGSNHIDPPATAIAVGTFLLNLAKNYLT
jgi:hypothetical protein